jgi:tetratricopeptide (TPR) repeat protein
MPAHIYIRTGDFTAAVQANLAATATDERYIACCKPVGVYPLMYYNHNRHFLAVAACMCNQSKAALAAADALGAAAREGARDAPMVEPFAAVPLLVRARFARWDDLLAQAPPDAKILPTTASAWHFARGMALVAKARPQDARAELDALCKAQKSLDKVQFGLNPAQNVLQIGEHLLAGRILASAGDSNGAIAEYRKAVEAQDALDYDEPPAFPWPARETLGAALIKAGDADKAESVFREDLKRNPKNPRSLLGVAECLKARKSADAAAAQAAAREALAPADLEISIDRM